MKVYDIVQVNDGSWSMAIVNGRKKHIVGDSLWDRRFRVLAKDGEYPTADHGFGSEKVPRNNIMLIDVNDFDFILFSHQSFCRVIEPQATSKTLESAIEVEAAARTIREIAHKISNDARNQLSFACEVHRASVKTLGDIRKTLDVS